MRLTLKKSNLFYQPTNTLGNKIMSAKAMLDVVLYNIGIFGAPWRLKFSRNSTKYCIDIEEGILAL